MTAIEDWFDTVGPGWRPIIIEVDRKIKEIAPDYTISQIKEKFGGLRYYYDVPPETPEEVWRQIEAIVREAEAKCFTLCEMCGEPGKPRTPPGFWIKTLCDEHANKGKRGRALRGEI